MDYRSRVRVRLVARLSFLTVSRKPMNGQRPAAGDAIFPSRRGAVDATDEGEGISCLVAEVRPGCLVGTVPLASHPTVESVDAGLAV